MANTIRHELRSLGNLFDPRHLESPELIRDCREALPAGMTLLSNYEIYNATTHYEGYYKGRRVKVRKGSFADNYVQSLTYYSKQKAEQKETEMKFDTHLTEMQLQSAEVRVAKPNNELQAMLDINKDIDELNTLARNLAGSPNQFSEEVLNELVNKVGELIHRRAFDIGELTKPSAPPVKKTARRK